MHRRAAAIKRHLNHTLAGLALVFGAGTAAAQTLPAVTGALTFQGYGGEMPSVQVQLQFSGWGDTTQPVSATLGFSGFGSTGQPVSAALGFAGWGAEDKPVSVSLAFSGLALSDDSVPVALAFAGWADIDRSISLPLSFSGYGLANNTLQANLSFEGCAKPTDSAIFPLVPANVIKDFFVNTDIDPNIDLEGNWIIEWENGTPASAFATLTKGGKWTCIDGEDGCRYGLQRDSNAGWQTNLFIDGKTTFASPAQVSETREVSNEYYYGVLGNWGGAANGTASETEIIGTWAYGDENGREVWTKVDGEILSVFNAAQSVNYGDTITISSEYAGPEYDMRGNRPTAWLAVLGEGLWGRHNFWIPEESGIEIGSVRYLCALQNGSYPTRGDSFDCLATGSVAGMRFDFNIWPDAKPGLYYLYFDDQVIPFMLELSGYQSSGQCDF